MAFSCFNTFQGSIARISQKLGGSIANLPGISAVNPSTLGASAQYTAAGGVTAYYYYQNGVLVNGSNNVVTVGNPPPTITTTNPVPAFGTGSMALNGTQGTNSSNPIVLPSVSPTASVGFALSGWFYPPVGVTQNPGATLYSLYNGSGSINVSYAGSSSNLSFNYPDGESFVVPNYAVTPGNWYNFTMNVTASPGGTSFVANYYLNNIFVGSQTLTSWPGGTYTNSTIGYNGYTNSGFFTGNVEGLSSYNQPLARTDISKLWNLGTNVTQNSFSMGSNYYTYALVDTNSIVMYYTFDISSAY